MNEDKINQILNSPEHLERFISNACKDVDKQHILREQNEKAKLKRQNEYFIAGGVKVSEQSISEYILLQHELLNIMILTEHAKPDPKWHLECRKELNKAYKELANKYLEVHEHFRNVIRLSLSRPVYIHLDNRYIENKFFLFLKNRVEMLKQQAYIALDIIRKRS